VTRSVTEGGKATDERREVWSAIITASFPLSSLASRLPFHVATARRSLFARWRRGRIQRCKPPPGFVRRIADRILRHQFLERFPARVGFAHLDLRAGNV